MEEQDSRSYLAQKVHPLFEKLLIELLITKPEDPVEFMCNWLQTVGQQFRPADKQNVPLSIIPEQAAELHQFSSTLPVQHQQNPQGNTPRKSQLQSLQNPVLNRQQSNQQQSQQISSHPQLSNQLSHQISGQPINSQVEIQLHSQKGLEQSEIQQKSFENSQEDLDNQFQSQNIKLIPQDQPTPSPIEPKKPVYPLNKQQSVLSKNNQATQNKTFKKSQTQSNPMLLQPLQQKPPQIQLNQNNTPRDQSLAQMKSSQGGSNQQSIQKLNPSRDEHEPQEVVIQQLNSLTNSKELLNKQNPQPNQSQQGQSFLQQPQQQYQQQQGSFLQQNQSSNQSQINSQIEKKNFKVFPKNKDQKQRVLKKMSQSFLFQHLNEQQREIVAQAMEEKKYKPNEVIIREGEDGVQMFLVDQGLLDCQKKIKPNEEKFVKSYHPGDLFGEMALLYNSKRAATIIAKTDCVLWALDKETFDAFIKEPTLKKRQAFDPILQRFEILKSIDDYMRLQIADAISIHNFNAKAVIFKEGDKADNFYLIQSGKLRALKLEGENEDDKQEKDVYEFTDYDYFGELAMLKEQPRQATIVCENNCILLGLDRQSFKKLLQPIHELLKRNSERYQNFSFY